LDLTRAGLKRVEDLSRVMLDKRKQYHVNIKNNVSLNKSIKSWHRNKDIDEIAN
jgi:hypothetical protein